MGWGEPMGDLNTERLEQIEANSARALLLSERIARLLLTLTDDRDTAAPDLHQQITKGRMALAEALGTKG